MADTVKDWFEDNCRTTGENKLVCETEQGVEVIDPLDEDIASQPATQENVQKFIDQNKATDVHGGEY